MWRGEVEQQTIQGLIDQLTPASAQVLLDKLQKKVATKKAKTNHYIEFPRQESRTFGGIPRPCTSSKDVIQHFAEEIIQNCDKKSVPTIKAQVVEALATLAEIVEPQKKIAVLTKAARFVMAPEREDVLRMLTNLAVN